MRTRSVFAGLAAGLWIAAAAAATDLRSNVAIAVDGAPLDGVLGYRIEFNRQPLPRSDSRLLGLSYSPDQRKLVLTVTQRGLARLQDWLNSASETGAPTAKTITVIAKNDKDEVLVRWEAAGAVPTTISSAAAGTFDEVTSTVEFLFDRLRILEASAK
jgi:hypothetical protein